MFLFESRTSPPAPAPTPKTTTTSPSIPPLASPPAPHPNYPLHSRQFVLPDAPVEAAMSPLWNRLPAEKPPTAKGPRHPDLNFSGNSSNAFSAPPYFRG